MKIDEHCAKSQELFGNYGEEYHRWMDHYAGISDLQFHRQILHHREGIEVGVMRFGENARNHLEQHVKDDYHLKAEEDIPSISDLIKKGSTSYPEKCPPDQFKFWR